MKKLLNTLLFSASMLTSLGSFCQTVSDPSGNVVKFKHPLNDATSWVSLKGDGSYYAKISPADNQTYKLLDATNGDFFQGTMVKSADTYTFYTSSKVKSTVIKKENGIYNVYNEDGDKKGSIKVNGKTITVYTDKNEVYLTFQDFPQDYAFAFFENWAWYPPEKLTNADMAIKGIKGMVANVDKDQTAKLIPLLNNYEKRLHALYDSTIAAKKVVSKSMIANKKENEISQDAVKKSKQLEVDLCNEAKSILTKNGQSDTFQSSMSNWIQGPTDWNQWRVGLNRFMDKSGNLH